MIHNIEATLEMLKKLNTSDDRAINLPLFKVHFSF
jgi:hypothetical protein